MKNICKLLIILILLSTNVYAGTVTTSGVTAQTIISNVRRNLNLATYDPAISDTEIIQWIDSAVRETVNITRCLESGVTHITLTSNTRRYSLGTTFLDIEVLEHDNGDVTDPLQIITLDRNSKADIGHSNAIGRPTVYCVWNNQIEIWPIPRTSESGTTLHAYVISFPSGVTTQTSPIETPGYLDTAIIYYTMFMAYQKLANYEQASAMFKLFDLRVKEYLINVLRRFPIE